MKREMSNAILLLLVTIIFSIILSCGGGGGGGGGGGSGSGGSGNNGVQDTSLISEIDYKTSTNPAKIDGFAFNKSGNSYCPRGISGSIGWSNTTTGDSGNASQQEICDYGVPFWMCYCWIEWEAFIPLTPGENRIVANASDGTWDSIIVTYILPLDIIPAVATVDPGGTQQFTAIATMPDMSKIDVTRDAIWSSSSNLCATVDATGLATGGLFYGPATITATWQNMSGQNMSGSATLFVLGDTSDGSISPFCPF